MYVLPIQIKTAFLEVAWWKMPTVIVSLQIAHDHLARG